MKFLELSKEKLQEENKKLYNIVIKNYKYDLVIFIARGSYLVGYDLAKLNNANLLEIFANRNGGKLKKMLRPILTIIPRSIKEKLRKKEMNSNYHEKNSDRKISFNEEIWKNYLDCKNILIVDDSIDTGFSVKSVKEVVINFFKDATVKVAVLNYFEKSQKIVKSDYSLYKETMILGPWSNDSKENRDYMKEYNKWHEEYEKQK